VIDTSRKYFYVAVRGIIIQHRTPPGQPSEVTRSNCFTAELPAPGPARVQETRCNYASKRKYFGTDWPGSLELRCSPNRVFPEECESVLRSVEVSEPCTSIARIPRPYSEPLRGRQGDRPRRHRHPALRATLFRRSLQDLSSAEEEIRDWILRLGSE